MDERKTFWTIIGESRRLMLIAIALLAVSQFFKYVEDNSYSFIGVGLDLEWSTFYLHSDPGGTGWDMHPWAWPVIFIAGLLFWTDTHNEPLWRGYIWWVTAIALLTCLVPTSIWTFGTFMGAVACALAFIAAFRHQREPAAAPPPKSIV